MAALDDGIWEINHSTSIKKVLPENELESPDSSHKSCSPLLEGSSPESGKLVGSRLQNLEEGRITRQIASSRIIGG